MLERPLFPPEVTGTAPRITLIGKQEARVEQHQGVLLYQSGCIAFKTACGQLTLTGRELRFLTYTAQEAAVGGEITGVTLGREGTP